MPKITAAQFFVLLFLCRVFTFFTIMPGISKSEGGASVLLALPLSAVLLIALILPGYFLLRGHKNQGLVEYAYQKSPAAGAATATFFALLALLGVVQNVVHFEMFISTAVYPDEPGAIFVVLFTLTVLYLVYLGLEPVARFSGGVLVVLLLSMALIVLALTREFNPVGLYSPLLDGVRPVVRGAVVTVNESSELILVLLFAPYVKGNLKKGFLWWVAAVLAALEGMMLVTLYTVQDYAVTQTYPLYAVAKMARLFYFQRMDAIHMVIWTLVGLVRASLYLYIARQCLMALVPQRGQKYILPAAGGVVLVLGLLLAYSYRAFEAAYEITLSGIPLLVGVVGVPLVLALLPKKKKGGEKV